MARELTLTRPYLLCLRAGALLLFLLLPAMLVAPLANAAETGSDARRRTSVDVVQRNRQMSGVADNFTTNSSLEKPGNIPVYLNSGNGSGVGCVELRSKRYVSDGRCTSIRPLIEVVCSGVCLPVRTLPWYSDYLRAWAGTSSMEWQCVDGLTRKRKLALICEDGTTRSYRIRVVKNCRCKQVVRRRHVDLTATPTTKGGRDSGGGTGDRRAKNGDLERPRESNEKRRKHGRNGRRRSRVHQHKETSSVSPLP